MARAVIDEMKHCESMVIPLYERFLEVMKERPTNGFNHDDGSFSYVMNEGMNHCWGTITTEKTHIRVTYERNDIICQLEINNDDCKFYIYRNSKKVTPNMASKMGYYLSATQNYLWKPMIL